MIFSATLLLTILTLSSAQKIDDVGPLRHELAEFFHTGQASDDYHRLLEPYKFPHLFRRGMKEVYDMPTICILCNLVFDLVIGERQLGMPRETIVELISSFCEDLHLEPERVCHGAIDVNVDVFIYTIDNYPNITSDRICSVMFQSSDCTSSDTVDWSINIAPGNSPERPKPNGTESSFRILQFGDFHYDPDYTIGGNAACGEPICCQSDQGEPLSPDEACGYWSDYRDADTSWQLVQESIRQAKTQDLTYVYYTGDTICHRIWDTSVEKNSEALTQLHTYLKEQFDIPVFPVFGNHEPHPLNLWPSNNVDDSLNLKWIFALAAQQWSELIGEDVSETVLRGGYYSVSPRPGLRVVGINSNIGINENFWLMYEDVDPYGQLQWLADTLKQAEDNNESVHILSHIPAGNPMMKIWNREYERIIERFANTITGMFNGDSHKDEFKVHYNTSNPTQAIGVAFNGASVTPFGNSNPSFKYHQVEEITFTLKDYEEWYFNLSLANSLGEGGTTAWSKLYSFVEAYGAANLLPEEVDQVLYRMTEDHSLLDDYFLFKSRYIEGDLHGGCDDGCKRGLLCGIVSTVVGNSEACNRFLALYDQ